MKKYQSFIILWIFLTFLCSLPMTGVLLILIGFISILFILVRVFQLIFKKITLKDFCITFSIILTSFLISGFVHYIRLEYLRYQADLVVNQVLEYKNKFGSYPKEHDLTIPNKSLFNGGIGYVITDYKDPYVSYLDSFMIFASYHYNFETLEWEYDPD